MNSYDELRYTSELADIDMPSGATQQNMELVIARLEQIASGAAADVREAAEQALSCARAVASAPKAELTDEQIVQLYRESFNAMFGRLREAPKHIPDTMLQFARAIARAVLAQAAPVAVPYQDELLAVVRECAEGRTGAKAIDVIDRARELVEKIAAAPAAPVAAAVPVGWVKNTGVQPVADDELVDIQLSNGRVWTKERAGGWEWALRNKCAVVAWRPAAPAPGASK